MSVIDAIIAKKLCGGGGGGSVPKPLTYDYMPDGYPKKAMRTVTVMGEQELAFSPVGSAGAHVAAPAEPLALVGGQTYTVSWDGTEYQCVCVDDGKDSMLGNQSLLGNGADTGEPFLYTANAFGTLDTAASHTISVKTTEETVTPMAEEFLPAGAPNTTVFYI